MEDDSKERLMFPSRVSHVVVWGVATLFSLAWAILAVAASVQF
jgi:hypothetical protein